MTIVPKSTKVCSLCKSEKPISEFHRKSDTKDGYQTKCKECSADYSSKHPLTKEQKLSKVMGHSAWSKTERGKASIRKAKLKAKYGITEQQYNSLLAQQKGLCAVCEKKMLKVCVDHNHKTGVVRGLLCDSCNIGLGHLRSDEGTEIFKKAIKYVESK